MQIYICTSLILKRKHEGLISSNEHPIFKRLTLFHDNLTARYESFKSGKVAKEFTSFVVQFSAKAIRIGMKISNVRTFTLRQIHGANPENNET